METKLSQLLESISVPVSDDGDTAKYRVVEIPEFGGRHYIGRDINGAPCLLIGSVDSGVKPPLRLAGIEAYFALQCHIVLEAQSEKSETLTVISCTAKDATLQNYFLYVGEMLLRVVGNAPTLQKVSEAVWKVVELFQKLTRPASKPITGLWGELYVIHKSGNPGAAVAAWRADVENRFDFSLENLRFEVKSTGARGRIHEFSFEQCNPPTDTVGVLASLTVESNGGGTSLYQLAERIVTQLKGNTDLIFKLQNNIADTLGEDLAKGLEARFDEHLAKQSLKLFDLNDVPAIRGVMAPAVSNIHFRSDLAGVQPREKGHFSTLGKQAKEILPN